MHGKMKKILLITLVLAALAGCSKTDVNMNKWRPKDFTHTGCAALTKAGLYSDDPSLLALKYEGGDLRVIHKNAELNCAIKERGLVCEVRIEGNDIYYCVDYELQEAFVANCICPVEEMSSAVTGLETDKEYTLHYCVLSDGYKPITFKFSKGLHQIINLDEWRNNVIVE